MSVRTSDASSRCRSRGQLCPACAPPCAEPPHLAAQLRVLLEQLVDRLRAVFLGRSLAVLAARDLALHAVGSALERERLGLAAHREAASVLRRGRDRRAAAAAEAGERAVEVLEHLTAQIVEIEVLPERIGEEHTAASARALTCGVARTELAQRESRAPRQLDAGFVARPALERRAQALVAPGGIHQRLEGLFAQVEVGRRELVLPAFDVGAGRGRGRLHAHELALGDGRERLERGAERGAAEHERGECGEMHGWSAQFARGASWGRAYPLGSGDGNFTRAGNDRARRRGVSAARDRSRAILC